MKLCKLLSIGLGLFLFCLNFSKAQKTDSAYLAEAFQEVPFIFEGTAIEAKGFKAEDTRIYTSFFIDVNKIFRGHDSLNCGIIEMVTLGGYTDEGEKAYYSHPFKADLHKRTIFFAYPSNRPASGLEISDHDFAVQSIGYHGSIEFVPDAYKEFQDFVASGFYQTFNSEEAIYTLLNEQPNIETYNCPQEFKDPNEDNNSIIMKHDSEHLKVYPNPGNNKIQIEFKLYKLSPASITLYSSKGQLVDTIVNKKEFEEGTYHETLSTENLAKGVYHVVLRLSNDEIIKQHVLIK